MASEKRKIAILGGTFNPVTKAHVYIGNFVKEYTHAGKVIYVPANIKYQKQWKEVSAYPPEVMQKEMLSEIVETDFCELEGMCSGKTYDMLQYFTHKYPSSLADLFFIVGSDKLTEIPRWYKADKIIQMNNVRFCVIGRQNNISEMENIIKSNPFLLKNREKFLLMNGDDRYQNISSTAVRNAIRRKDYKTAEAMMPDGMFTKFKDILTKTYG